MDVHLLYFGFYKGEPVSFFLSLPEINQVFKYVNGKLDLLGKIKFLWHSFRKTNRKAFGILFGVVPAHQGKGLDGAMVLNSKRILQYEYKRYDEYEMNWIGDFNPKMSMSSSRSVPISQSVTPRIANFSMRVNLLNVLRLYIEHEPSSFFFVKVLVEYHHEKNRCFAHQSRDSRQPVGKRCSFVPLPIPE